VKIDKRFFFMAVAGLAVSIHAAAMTVTATADSYLAGGASAADRSYGGHPQMLVGNHPSLGSFHGLLQFDLFGLSSTTEVNSVVLKMNKPAGGVGGTFTIKVYELCSANSDWVEGTKSGVLENDAASWHKKGVAAWAGQGGASVAGTDYADVVLASYSGAASPGEAVYVSEAAFKDVVARSLGGTLNLGLGLNSGVGSKYYRFSTKESGCAAELLINQSAAPKADPSLNSSSATTEPSDGQQLAEKKSAVGYDAALDAARKAKMGPDELAWEAVLEQHLGGFYLPPYKKAKEAGRETAWDYVQDDPSLPRVLIIGDSISRGYTLPVRHALAGKANVHRAPCNCGPTAKGVRDLDQWLGDKPWDLIFFNFGIHDRADPEAYAVRLEQILTRLKKTGARLVFANTTPLPEGSGPYRREDGLRINETAVPIIERHGIPVCDFFSAMMPVLSELQNPNDCHFNDRGYEFLGKLAVNSILDELQK
jgi:hypothetical protein